MDIGRSVRRRSSTRARVSLSATLATSCLSLYECLSVYRDGVWTTRGPDTWTSDGLSGDVPLQGLVSV